MKTLIRLAGLTLAAGLVASAASAQFRNDRAPGQRVSIELSTATTLDPRLIRSEADTVPELKPLRPASEPAQARKVRVIVPSPYLQ